jgi:hypothetical protein
VASLLVKCCFSSSAWELKAEDNHVYVYESIGQDVYLDRSI